MIGPAEHTAEQATPGELKAASLRLTLWLAALVVIGPAVRALPLGQTTRTAILAWILAAAALYWLYGGLGYRPLLLLQLVFFSTAITLLSIKVLLVGLSVTQFDFLRETGRGLLIAGGACAGANLGMMLVASLRRR